MSHKEQQEIGIDDIFYAELVYCTHYTEITVNGSCKYSNLTVYCVLVGDDLSNGNTTSDEAILTVQG